MLEPKISLRGWWFRVYLLREPETEKGSRKRRMKKNVPSSGKAPMAFFIIISNDTMFCPPREWNALCMGAHYHRPCARCAVMMLHSTAFQFTREPILSHFFAPTSPKTDKLSRSLASFRPPPRDRSNALNLFAVLSRHIAPLSIYLHHTLRPHYTLPGSI